MKILIVSSFLPYPLYSGGQTRLFNLIKELSKTHEITLICEKRYNQTIEDIMQVEKICKKVITVDRRKQWSIKNILQTAFSFHSFLVTGHTHPYMKILIEQELHKERFDLIHVETYYVMQNLPTVNIPIVLVEHNIEYLVYSRFMDHTPHIFRPLINIDIIKMRNEEKNYWKKADRVVTVSEDDKIEIEKAGISPSIVPNGVNPEQFSLKNIQNGIKQEEKKILFIGDFKWIQNTDAARWIIKDIWPQIKMQLPDNTSVNSVTLWIVGRKIPKVLRHLSNDPNILFDEEQSKLPTWEIFQKAYILLAPIRVGGGSSYKILESMAVGTPVVTTKLSADAIRATDLKEILVGTDAIQLAQKTVQIIKDTTLYANIALNGRLLIENNFTWKEIAKKLDSVYKSLAK